jgi:hypothetical protein
VGGTAQGTPPPCPRRVAVLLLLPCSDVVELPQYVAKKFGKRATHDFTHDDSYTNAEEED